MKILILRFWNWLRPILERAWREIKKFVAWAVASLKAAFEKAFRKKHQVVEEPQEPPIPFEDIARFTLSSGTTWLSFPKFGMPRRAFPDEGFILRVGSGLSIRRHRRFYEHYYYTS